MADKENKSKTKKNKGKYLKKLTFIKKHWLVFTSLPVIGIIVSVLVVLMMAAALLASQEAAQENDDCGDSSSANMHITGTSGDWTKKGTANYNGAKLLWGALKNKGANDTQAAGVVGALAHEAGGAFGVPDIAQGYYTWTNHPTEGNAGITSAGVPEKAASVTKGGMPYVGASMFQYTPFTKYAKASDKKAWRSYPKLIDYWFKHQVPSHQRSMADLKAAKTLDDAVQFALDVEESIGSQDAKSTRLQLAKQAYMAFKGVGGSKALQDTDTTAVTANNSCNDNDIDADATGVLKVAQHMKGWFTYNESRTAIMGKTPKKGDYDWVDKHGTMDCSGFVWTVLQIAGYKAPSQVWATKAMEDDARGDQKYLKRVSAKNAKAGDVVIVNVASGADDDGHTAILVENWHGNNTKVIQEGGGPDPVNIEKFGYGFYKLLEDGRVTFGRPIKAN